MSGRGGKRIYVVFSTIKILKRVRKKVWLLWRVNEFVNVMKI